MNSISMPPIYIGYHCSWNSLYFKSLYHRLNIAERFIYIEYSVFFQKFRLNQNFPGTKKSVEDDVWSFSPYLCSLEISTSTKIGKNNK